MSHAAEGAAKVAFVTTPMWISALLIVMSDIRPAPAPHDSWPEGATPLSPANASQVEWLQRELARAQKTAEENQRKVDALEATLGQKVSPILEYVDALPAQGALAMLAGTLGAFSIAGPSSFVRFFLAVVGSAVGGLMVGGCASYFAGFSPFLLGSMGRLLHGYGTIAEYVLWFSLFFLGILRWFSGWECGLYAVVEEIEMDDQGQVAVLTEPLLGRSPGAPLPQPAGKAADAV